MDQLLVVTAPFLGPVQLREVALGVCHGNDGNQRFDGCDGWAKNDEAVGGWLMCQVNLCWK